MKKSKIFMIAGFIAITSIFNVTEIKADEQWKFEGWNGDTVSNAEDMFDNEWKFQYPILEGVEEQEPIPNQADSSIPGSDFSGIGMQDIANIVGGSGGMGYVNFNGKTYAYWNQGDFGGNIQRVGCGPTSLAILLSNLTGKSVNPRKVWNEAVRLGVTGTSYGSDGNGLARMLESYLGSQGYTVRRTLDYNEARRHLSNGGMALGNVGGRDYYSNPPRRIGSWFNFNAGHFVAYAGADKNGNIFTLDPGWRERTGLVDKNMVQSATKAYFLIEKKKWM